MNTLRICLSSAAAVILTSGWLMVTIAHAETSGAESTNSPVTSTDTLDTGKLDKLKRGKDKQKKINIFPSKSWYVPPPPPPPAPPPPPVAPPLPFTFIGKQLEEDGKLIIFLADGNRMHMVSTGEIIDEKYSVDSIDNSKLTFTYLPMNIKQFIHLGDTP